VSPPSIPANFPLSPLAQVTFHPSRLLSKFNTLLPKPNPFHAEMNMDQFLVVSLCNRQFHDEILTTTSELIKEQISGQVWYRDETNYIYNTIDYKKSMIKYNAT